MEFVIEPLELCRIIVRHDDITILERVRDNVICTTASENVPVGAWGFEFRIPAVLLKEIIAPIVERDE